MGCVVETWKKEAKNDATTQNKPVWIWLAFWLSNLIDLKSDEAITISIKAIDWQNTKNKN